MDLHLDGCRFSFTFKVIFIKALHFPLLSQSCTVLQVLHLQLMSYNTIANTGNDSPCLVRNTILPSLHLENITNESLWRVLSKPSTALCAIGQLIFLSE